MFIEFPPVQGVIIQGIDQVKMPRMVKIHQQYDDKKIQNVEQYLTDRMNQVVMDKEWFCGKSICIAVGSRGIRNLLLIVKTVCGMLKSWGAKPFVIPAMGSHGGGTSEGQLEILRGYDITECNIDAPIISSMEVVRYGELSDKTPLYCDKNAYESDGIILINKEKPHTAFRGKYESGLAKMIAIGIAKHKGAAAFHRQGFSRFAQRIPQAAECFLQKMPVVYGIGIVENAYDEICEIGVADAEHFLEMDAENLEKAKKSMAKFKFSQADVLVIDEIGKDISGHGHDPNVTGRAAVPDDSFKQALDLKRMVILDISENSHHNGNGIADADITTRRCVNSIDWSVVWTNIMTSNEIQGCKIPFYANSDREAIAIAIRSCMGVDQDLIKIARIHNTLQLETIEVSQALFEEIKDDPGISWEEGPYEWEFDSDGNFEK